MTSEWVDFKKVKEAVDIQMVLGHYSIAGLAKNGDELRGPCPIHKGKVRSKNFTVNVRKNAFNCFSKDCGARGNVLDFVAAMEGCNVREAALKLQEWFKIGESDIQSPRQVEESDEPGQVQRGIYEDSSGALYELVITQARAKDSEPVVVYRELFGDYEFYVAAPANFDQTMSSAEQATRFKLVKAF
jgi:hypothetical protein